MGLHHCWFSPGFSSNRGTFVDTLPWGTLMKIIPLTLKQANGLVSDLHRHHKPVQGHRFSLGLTDGDELVGAAICGRPVSRGCDPYMTLEVIRLVTNGVENGCSMLYGACARAGKAMRFRKIQTYILDSEPGTSLKAAGWTQVATTSGGQWKHTAGPRRTDQPTAPKTRWEKVLNL